MITEKRLIFLCGGALLELLDDLRYRSIFAHMMSSRTILVYPFARESKDWSCLMQQLNSLAVTQSLALTWTLASSSGDKRKYELQSTTVVFIFGGDEERFFETVNHEELRQVLKCSHVVCSSAGVNVFSRVYYSNEHQAIRTGSGILPIKTICHYSEGKEAACIDLATQPTPGRVIALADGEIIILHSERLAP